MKNKDTAIGLIDMRASGKPLLKEKDVIVIDDNPQEIAGSFILNGCKYAPVKRHLERPNKGASKLGLLMAGMGVIAGDDFKGIRHRELPKGTDIIEEYGLIQNKKSNLSKWERDEVVRIFEFNYYKVQ